jgi:DNA-binding XRE family transcriptional regulator
MKPALKVFRQEIQPKVTQDDIAKLVGIKTATYARIEQGYNTTYTTANVILRVLNQKRKEHGLSEVTLEELSLKIV